ncbi:MAG: hypothetical protein Q8P84_02565 [Deltaproteobacteria bacterium]|nr:hypothetical protein [Deltaproteobacteria bacterium]
MTMIQNPGLFIVDALFASGPLGMQTALEVVCPITPEDLELVGRAVASVQSSFLKSGIAIHGMNDAMDMFLDGMRFGRIPRMGQSLESIAKAFAPLPPELYSYHAAQATFQLFASRPKPTFVS